MFLFRPQPNRASIKGLTRSIASFTMRDNGDGSHVEPLDDLENKFTREAKLLALRDVTNKGKEMIVVAPPFFSRHPGSTSMFSDNPPPVGPRKFKLASLTAPLVVQVAKAISNAAGPISSFLVELHTPDVFVRSPRVLEYRDALVAIENSLSGYRDSEAMAKVLDEQYLVGYFGKDETHYYPLRGSNVTNNHMFYLSVLRGVCLESMRTLDAVMQLLRVHRYGVVVSEKENNNELDQIGRLLDELCALTHAICFLSVMALRGVRQWAHTFGDRDLLGLCTHVEYFNGAVFAKEPVIARRLASVFGYTSNVESIRPSFFIDKITESVLALDSPAWKETDVVTWRPHHDETLTSTLDRFAKRHDADVFSPAISRLTWVASVPRAVKGGW